MLITCPPSFIPSFLYSAAKKLNWLIELCSETTCGQTGLQFLCFISLNTVKSMFSVGEMTRQIWERANAVIALV